MPENTRLTIRTIELTPEGILIREMGVIDGNTGKSLKIAKLTPELTEFLKCVEIDVTKYFQIQKMKKKNPEFKHLIDNFNLTT